MDDLPQHLVHPSFPQPDRTKRSVWHYMTLAKFIALLDTRSLYFCRLDCLSDDYEGALPRRWQPRRRTASAAAEEEMRRLRETCFVNCWNMSDDESEALWRLYGEQNASIAIRATYDELLDVARCDHDLRLGLVSYVDYETATIPNTGDRLTLVMHKRRAFRHEEEVRFVKVIEASGHGDGETRTGLEVPVDLERLVHGIAIDPYAPEWFEKVVRAIVAKFAPALCERISWSSMKADPLS
jgi:hypothetical protein